MTDINTNLADLNAPVEEGGIDIKAIIAKILTYWYLFVFSILICLSIAIVKASLTTPIWNITGKILIEDNSTSTTTSNSGEHSGLESLIAPKTNLTDEIEILRSTNLIGQLVDQTNLNVTVYSDRKFKSDELYEYTPFVLNIKYKGKSIKERKYDIEILDNKQFLISNKEENLNVKSNFGDTIRLSQYNILLDKSQFFHKSGYYSIDIQTQDDAIRNFLINFQATFTDKTSSALSLSYNYTNPKRGEDVLEQLISDYRIANLDNKLRTQDSILKFIDGRIAIVYDELNTVQIKFEKFKQDHQMVDVIQKAASVVSTENTYSTTIKQQEIQLSVIDAIEKALNKSGNTKQIPSPVSINNGVLTAGIDGYNTLLVSREKLKLSLTDNNPIIRDMDNQIDYTRNILLKGLSSYRTNFILTQNQLKNLDQSALDQIKEVPSIQRISSDFSRQQSIYEELYQFLLQKREEVAISRTSTLTNVRVIEHAKSSAAPFQPKKSVIYLMGLAIGILIPALYLIVKEFLNTKIMSKHDIEMKTSIPIVGEIGHKTSEDALVVSKDARTNISEQFRSLRTNLQYLVNSNKSNVLLFTSSMSGEGKTFLSLNLGSALALGGKKIVFLELDLRKPKFSVNLGLDNQNGFTNYIISDQLDYHSIIKPTWFNENCFLISSGPIPPNPAELLMNVKLEKLIDQLKKDFDYVIIDTAPVGMVLDALLIEKFADITFYVVREEYTHKPQLDMINNLKISNKVRNPYLIVNDIKPQKGNAIYGFGYGYGYGFGYGREYGAGYGYGYGYGGSGTDEEKTSFFKRLFNTKSKN